MRFIFVFNLNIIDLLSIYTYKGTVDALQEVAADRIVAQLVQQRQVLERLLELFARRLLALHLLLLRLLPLLLHRLQFELMRFVFHHFYRSVKIE